MDIKTNDSVFQKIEHLEKNNRILRRLVCFSFIVSMFLLSTAIIERYFSDLFPRKQIRTQSVVIESDEGNIQAELKTQDNVTMLTFFENGIFPRISLALTSGEPGLHVYDSRGVRQSVFGMNQYGPSLIFNNPNGVLHSGLIPYKYGSLGLLSRNNNKIDFIRVGEEDLSRLF